MLSLRNISSKLKSSLPASFCHSAFTTQAFCLYNWTKDSDIKVTISGSLCKFQLHFKVKSNSTSYDEEILPVVKLSKLLSCKTKMFSSCSKQFCPGRKQYWPLNALISWLCMKEVWRYYQWQVTNLYTAVLLCRTKYLYFVSEKENLLNILKIPKTLFSLENWRKKNKKDFIYPLYITFICKVGQMRVF